jgi:hypothetical protein
VWCDLRLSRKVKQDVKSELVKTEITHLRQQLKKKLEPIVRRELEQKIRQELELQVRTA